MNNRFPAPTPEIHYIPAIFRKIQNGELKIPAFQRGFVWSKQNILALMDSIYNGYPIGSLLFWNAEHGALKELANSFGNEFSPGKINYVNYVLDGMQRLTTLFNVFQGGNEKLDEFKVAYSFTSNRFFYPFDEDADDELFVYLESLFNPRELLEFQSKAIAKGNSDEIISKSIELQSIFKEYLIPTVTIKEREVQDVVEIFKRVNSTGVNLNIVDFMRALTWTDDFDLNLHVKKLTETARSINFDISDDSHPMLVKYIAIFANRETTANGMYKMKDMPSTSLSEAVRLADESLPEVIALLRDGCNIQSMDYLGYEGQFLIAAAAIRTSHLMKDSDFKFVVKLIWQIGFEESLRGKQDHYLERILSKIYDGNWRESILDKKFDHSAYSKRRFLKGKALTSAFVCMYSRHANMNLKFDDFTPLIKISRKFGETKSDKIFANLAYKFDANMPAAFSSINDIKIYLSTFETAAVNQWCLENFIDPDFDYVDENDFIEKRSILLAEKSNDLM